MSFADHFSGGSADYRRYRPQYPAALFAFVAALSPGRATAWDCATGTGQAALGLRAYFDVVVATDASRTQIAQATPAPGIHYAVMRAEHAAMRTQSIDLITVAQALHWFDPVEFFAEARRVLKPRGVLAVWTYQRPKIAPPIDGVLAHFHDHVLGPYWPRARRFVERGYNGIELPFAVVPAPDFEIVAAWALEELVGYLGTWSAVAAYRARHGVDPRHALVAELAQLWGDPTTHLTVRWPVILKLGTCGPAPAG